MELKQKRGLQGKNNNNKNDNNKTTTTKKTAISTGPKHIGKIDAIHGLNEHSSLKATHRHTIWEQKCNTEAPNVLRETGFMRLQGSGFRNHNEEAGRRKREREGRNTEGKRERVR